MESKPTHDSKIGVYVWNMLSNELLQDELKTKLTEAESEAIT